MFQNPELSLKSKITATSPIEIVIFIERQKEANKFLVSYFISL
jgi:hypothetical protein